MGWKTKKKLGLDHPTHFFFFLLAFFGSPSCTPVMATPKAIDDRIRIPKNFPKKQTLSLLQLYAELREANLGAELFPTICARITSLYPDALTPFTVDSLKQRVEYCLAEGIVRLRQFKVGIICQLFCADPSVLTLTISERNRCQIC